MRNVNIKRHDITLPINELYTECVQINVFQIKILPKVSPQIFNIKRWGEREGREGGEGWRESILSLLRSIITYNHQPFFKIFKILYIFAQIFKYFAFFSKNRT